MKLRLPHKFQAALMAALASVSFTTLSTGTLGVATGAALLAGQKAQAQVTGIHPMQEVVVAGETYTTTTENGILVAEGDKADGSPISVPGYTTAEYLVLTSTNGTVTNLGRYKVNATANLQNFGTVVLAAGSYQGEGGAVNFNGGQIFVNGGVTLTNDFIIGTSGYVESGYDGAFRLSGNNTFAGSLTLVQDAKMTVVGSSTVQGVVSGAGKTLTLGQGGTLIFNNQTTLGGLAMGSASATFNGAAAAKNSIGTVTSNAGTTLTLINTDATIGGDQSFKGNLYIGSGSTVTVIQNDSLGYSVTDTITVAEGGTLAFGNKRWTLGANNTIVMAGGTITGTGDGTNGTLDYYANGGVLRATKTSTVAAPIRLRNSNQTTTFDVVKDAELTIDGIINGNGNLAKAGAGTLTLKKNATHTGSTSLQGGTLKIATGATLNEGVFTMANGATFVNDGTATIGKVGSASTLGGTLTNTGTLNLAGDITVNTDVATSFEVATTGEKTYVGGGTSGYLSSDTTTYYLVHTTGGTVTNSANITGVSNLTFDEGTGNITFTRNATGDGIYYVNDNLTYDAETMGAATGFAIAAGATLTSNGSAYSPGKALHGAGTYALSSGATALNSGLGFGTDWTGTVLVSNTNASQNIQMNDEALTNGNQSTLELSGFKGWLANDRWKKEVATNIRLTDYVNGSSTRYAWVSEAYSSTSTDTMTLTGKWSGTGTYNAAGTNGGARYMHYNFKGDITEWTGAFLKTSQNTVRTNLTFSENAKNVNIRIDGSGNFGVIVDTDATFSKAVTADTFTVNAGRTATLNANTTVGGLTGAGNVVTPMLPPSDATKVTITLNGTGTGANAYTFDGSLAAHYLSKTGSGTQTFNGDVTLNRLAISSGTTYFNGAVSVDSQGYSAQGDQVINLSGGSTTYFNGPLSYTNGNNYAIILSGANTTAHFGGTTNLGTKHIGNQAGTLVVVDTGASLTLNQFSNSSTLTNNGAVTLEHGATLNVGILRSENLTNDGTINATNDVTVDTISGAGTITIATTKSLFYGTSGSTKNPNGSYAGTITAGRLQKWGTGTLTLSGLNAFSNETLLNRGTLEVAQVGSLGGQGVTTSANTSLIFNTADDGIYGGSITGTGSVTKSGEGNLVLTGANSYTGDTMVNQGTLAFQGHSTLGGDVTVGTGATLSLQADNCLTTTGTLTFETGSTLDLSHYSGTISTTPVTLASAGSISGFSGVNIVTSAPKGMEASVTLGGTGNNEIQVSYSAKQGATMHLYILTGQSNSLGAVKGTPLAGGMLAAYQSQGLLWNGNMHKNRPSGADTNRYILNPDWQVVAPQEPGKTMDASAYSYNPCMGAEYGFSYIMENKGWTTLLGENDTLAVVKSSLDGGGNGYWLQNDNAYKTLLDSVQLSIQDAVDMGYTKISLDGLMFLQGESNSTTEAGLAAERFEDFLSYLKTDLQSWLTEKGLTDVTLSFDTNSVTGEPATWTANNIEDPTSAGSVTIEQLRGLALKDGMVNADQNGYGFVYTRDLAKITSGDSSNVHYRGTAQLTIGARYAYAFAVQNGVDVGAVRGQDDSATLDTGAAWWMETTPTENDIAVWDISSVSQSIPIPECNKIADGKTLTVGGIRIEDVYNPNATEPGYGSVGITGGTIQIGKAGLEGSGITLVGADLSISSAVNAVANQTWSAQNGHKLAVNGTTTISEGATLTFADDLYLTFGAITGTGNLEIGTVTFDMGLDYMMANGLGVYMTSGGAGDNGFFTGKLDLVRLTGDASTITFTGESGSIANIAKAGDLVSHTLALSGDGKALQITDLAPDAETYFTRKGEVIYTSGDTAEYGIYNAEQVMLSGTVENPATLKLASELKEGTTIQASGLGGTVNIVDGVTLAASSVNAAGGSVVLAGEGTFALNGTAVLPTNVTLADADNWHGTVKIANTTGGAGYNIDINALGNANSTVEFDGVVAYLNTDSYTYTPNIKFSGAGLNIDAGNTDATYTFSGNISGSGNLNLSLSRGSDRHTYVFAGDVEGWNGELKAPTNGRTLTVKFAGKADTVNVAITKTGGTLNLVADTDTTFNGAVSGLNSLAVSANKSARFQAGLSTGSTTLNANSTLAITGTGVTYNLGTVNTGTGTLDLFSSITTGAMTIAQGSTVKLAGVDMITAGGLLTLQAGATLDLARLFETQQAPVQNAPLRSNASPQLFSALGGGSSTLSLNDNLGDASLPTLGAITPTDGGTYVLASANDISLGGNVNLLNIAEGYTGSLSAQGDTGNKQLILTLAAVTEEFIWNGGNGTWDTNAQNWHKAGSQESIAFTADSDARFDSASTDATVSVSGPISAGSMAVDSGANVTLVTTSGSNTLNATEGITVAQGGTLKLQGTGVTGELSGSGVVVGNAIAADGTISKAAVLGNLSLGSDWSGTVVLSGGPPTTVEKYTLLDNITSYFSQGDSTIRMNGVNGYFTGVTVGANLELTGNGADGTGTALTITAGNDQAVTTFSGSISGNGDLVYDKNGAGVNTYKFTGNISAWNGKLTNANRNSGALTVQLADGANVVNADIVRVGNRVMNVTVSNNATFNGDVTDVNNFSVDSGSSATLNGLTRVAAISGNGDIEVGSTGTLALTNTTAITFGGDLGVDGTLKLAGSNLLTTATLDFGNDAILDLTNIHPGESTNPITLVRTTGGITGTLSEVELAHLTAPEGYRGVLTQDSNNLVLTFEMIAENLIWNTGSGNWDVNHTQQWHTAEDPSTNTVFKQNDNVKFETGASTATLTEAIAAGTMTLDSGANLTLATGTNNLTTKDFVATGGASLVKNGTGAVHFGNAAGDADTLQSLTVNDGDISFEGKVTVTGTGYAVQIPSGASNVGDVEFKGGLTVDNKVLTYNGNIKLSGESSIGGLDIKSTAAGITVTENASLSIVTDLWAPVGAGIILEEGATLDMKGQIVAKGRAGAESSLKHDGAGSTQYGIDSGTYTYKNVDIATAANATIGNKLENSTLTSAHNVTLNNAANTLTSTMVTANTLTVAAGMDLGAVTVNDGATLALTSSSPVTIGSGTIAGTLKLGKEEQFVVDDGSFTFASGSTLDLSSLSITQGTPVTLATATGTGSFTATGLRGVELNFGSQTYEGARLVVDGNSLMLTFVEPGRDLIWQGGPGEWNETPTNESWYHEEEGTYTMVAFEEGDNVSFSVQTYSPVALTEDIYAGNVTIDKGVQVSLTNGTAGKVELSAGDIVVSGDLTVTNVGVSADEMIINEGAHVTAAVTVEGYTGVMESTVSGSGDVTKTGAGNLNIHGENAGFNGTLTIEQGGVIAGTSTALGNTPNVVLAGEGVELSGSIAPSGDINITSTADGTVSANLQVAQDKVLTFNTTGNTTITESGTISGAGDIVKDGTGTLVLANNNTYSGDLNINQGTVLVSNVGALGGTGTQNVTVNLGGNIAFAELPETSTDTYTATSVSLGMGSTLTFSGLEQLNIGTLSLTAESALDLSNISLDTPNHTYVLAHVDNLQTAESGIWLGDAVQYITMNGIHGDALTPDSLVSLHYNSTSKELTLRLDSPDTDYAYYWGDAAEGVWDVTGQVWYSNENLTGEPKAFPNRAGALNVPADSVYFMNADGGVQTISIGDLKETGGSAHNLLFVRDMIVANGEYHFTAPKLGGNQYYIQMDVNRVSNFVVRGGAKAYFDGVAVSAGQFDVIHIESEAEAQFEKVYQLDTFSINNEGKFKVILDSDYVATSLLSHMDNYGEMTIVAKDTAYSGIALGQALNREGGTLTLAANVIYGDPQGVYGDNKIHNEGKLIIGTLEEKMARDISVTIPVQGEGTLTTIDPASTVTFEGTVEQTSMLLKASLSEFDDEVTIADTTTVDAGATALFTGGGSLGDVTLKPAVDTSVATMQFTGNDSGAQSYTADTVTAGAGSVFDVQQDATVTIASYNAGGAAEGAIVVGDGTGANPAHLVVSGVTNADTLNVQGGTADLDGEATVTTLTQSGGTAKFNAGGFVDYGTVSGGTLAIGGDQVLTLGHTITETGDYTVAKTTGSINADALTLHKDMANAGYVEVHHLEQKTDDQSGFLSGGEQYVKVFDIQSGTLSGNNITVTHKDAAGPMKLISSSDPDHPEYAGYGYLDTSEPVYTTYYVRDNYVTGVQGTRGGDDRSMDYVKLSQVIATATAGGETLAAVVFDQTGYNNAVDGSKAYHGTLTVDTNTKADLFHVTEEGTVEAPDTTRAAINIAENVVVLADQNYAGVEGQLDLTGAGVYQIDNRGDLGTNVSLLGATTDGITPWQGTVRLTGSAEKVNTTPLSVGSGSSASTIEFDQWTGSFKDTGILTPMQSNAKILLTGTGVQGDSAITLTEGNANLLWTNTVNGDNARIDHGQAGDFTLLMTGDTSGWNGTFTQSAADTVVSLGFKDNVSASGVQNANVLANAGGMFVEYGGNVKTVNGNATVYGEGVMNLLYTGTGMQVNSNISEYLGQGSLEITVGDGTNAASATFNGAFTDTEDAIMYVEKLSTATLATDAELLRVVGDEGSNVNVTSGHTLSLASTDPEEGYSQFYGVNNSGTIQMKANGGDIKLVDTEGHTAAFNLGDLELTEGAGTAAIETSGVSGQVTNVDIVSLSGPNDAAQVLKLTNDNGVGTVNYNLGGDGSTADFTGTVAYGGNGGETNLVLKDNASTANSILETSFSEGAPAGSAANIVVDTDAAKVIGLSSDGNSANKTMVVSGSTGDNKSLEITGDDDYTYAGKLGENLDIAYTGEGSQTISGGVDGFNGKVTVDSNSTEGGVLAILEASSVSITDLTIGANDMLYLDGTAVVSGTLEAQGGTTTQRAGTASVVEGSLTLGSTSTLDVSAAGGTGGLDLFGALTINTGAQLSSGDLTGVAGLGWFEMYDLAFDVTEMLGFGTVDWSEGVDATQVFANTGLRENEYYVRYSGAGMAGGNGSNVGAVYIYRIPEPTTSTLSLLALAALAARRRRK